MRKKHEKIEKTKQAFIDTFCLLYRKKPIEKITVQDITRKAGFNRCTFYQYFSDIDELLEHVEDDVLTYMEKKHPKEELYETVPLFVQEIVKIYDEKSTYLNALLGQHGSNSFLRRLKEKVLFSQHELNLKGKERIAPYLLEFHATIFLSLFQLWQQRKKDLSIEELAELMISLHNKGMSLFISKKQK